MIRQMPDWPAARASGRRRAGAGGLARGGRDVGGERGQVGVGPRGERPARPYVEFVPGQPAIHERGLQRLDHLLAVGVARPDPIAARTWLVFRSYHHRRLPPAGTMRASAARLIPGGHAQTESLPAGRRIRAAA